MARQGDDNQLDTERQRYQLSHTGDFATYAMLLGQSFASRINLPAQILRDAHHATLGRYKERLLMKFISQFIPRRYEVGSGFVIFPREFSGRTIPAGFNTLTFRDHTVSPQCDIIVYDSHDFPVVYKDEDFVIVRPESVRAVIEVKGTLNWGQIGDAVGTFIKFGRSWSACSQFYVDSRISPPDPPQLFLIGWQVYIGPDNKPGTDGKRLRKQIVRIYQSELSEGELKELGSEGYIAQFPVLSSAYIYDDCIIWGELQVRKDGSNEWGLATSHGQFVSFDDDKPKRDGDKTVAFLLDCVLSAVESPRSPLSYSHDRAGQVNICPHPDQGFTPWVSRRKSSWR